jgi:hypothetical protein
MTTGNHPHSKPSCGAIAGPLAMQTTFIRAACLDRVWALKGKFRVECLTRHYFTSLDDPQ